MYVTTGSKKVESHRTYLLIAAISPALNHPRVTTSHWFFEYPVGLSQDPPLPVQICYSYDLESKSVETRRHHEKRINEKELKIVSIKGCA